MRAKEKKYMPIIKWEPFEEMDHFFDVFSGTSKHFTLAIDVYETKNDVVVKAPLAGVDPKNVEISVENDILIITGETKKESEVEEKNYYRKEVRSGSFHRAVAMPTHVKSSEAKAEFENGVLKITIPKAEEAKPKTVKIELKDNK